MSLNGNGCHDDIAAFSSASHIRPMTSWLWGHY